MVVLVRCRYQRMRLSTVEATTTIVTTKTVRALATMEVGGVWCEEEGGEEGEGMTVRVAVWAH